MLIACKLLIVCLKVVWRPLALELCMQGSTLQQGPGPRLPTRSSTLASASLPPTDAPVCACVGGSEAEVRVRVPTH